MKVRPTISAFRGVARDYENAASLWNTFLDPSTIAPDRPGEAAASALTEPGDRMPLHPVPGQINAIDDDTEERITTAAATLRNVAKALEAGLRARQPKRTL